MAAETELERLIVRLLGDSRQYKKMLDESKRSTKTTMDAMGRLIDKNTKKFVKGQRSMQAALRKTGTLLKTTGARMKSLGTSLSLRLTLPLIALAGVATKSFSSFDDAMTKSTSIMKVTERQIAAMRKTALDLSAGGLVTQTPKELAEAYFFLASAGKSAEQSMALLPKVAAFATAGAFDMALATDLLTDAQSALGLSSKNVARDTENLVRLGDLLVGANTLANASVQQFATALTSKAGAAFKSFGIEIEDGIALLAAFADQGIKAELAGNATDRLLRLLAKSALENAEEFKKLNVEVFDISGEFNKFKDIIGDLERALSGMSTSQKIAALDTLGFQARVQGVILPLLGTSDAIGRYRRELKGMGDVTQDVSDKQMQSFAAQWKKLRNLINVAAIEIGQRLAPALLSLNNAIKSGIQKWRELSPTIQKFVILAGAALAALGPLLIIFGSITFLSGQVVIGISAMIPIIKTLNIAFVALGISSTTAWASVTLGISLAIPALIGLVFLLKKVQDKFGIFDPIIDAAKKLWSTLKKELTPIIKLLVGSLQVDLFPALVDIIGAFGQLLNAALPLIPLFAQSLVFSIKAVAFVIKNVILPPVLALAKALGFVASAINFVTGQDIRNQIRTTPFKKPTPKAVTTGIDEVQKARNVLTGLFPSRKRGIGAPTADESPTAKLKKDTDAYIRSLVLQSQTFGMTNRQAQIYELRLKGISVQQLRQLQFADRWLTAQENAAKAQRKAADEFKALQERGRQLWEQNLTPLERFRKRVLEVNKLFRVGALGRGRLAEIIRSRELKAAKKELDDLQKSARINVTVSGFESAIRGSAEAASKIQAFRNLQIEQAISVREKGSKDPEVAAKDTANNTGKLVKIGKDQLIEQKKFNRREVVKPSGIV